MMRPGPRNKQNIDDLEETPEVKHLKEWLALKSKRGTHGFIDITK